MAFSITIGGVSPEEVFGYVSDVSRHAEWANPNASLRIENVSGGPPMLGSKYRSEALFLKKPVTADLEITAYDRPSRFAYSVAHHQAGKKDVHMEHTYTLRAEGGGTAVEKSSTGDGSKVVGFLAYPAIRKDALTSLRNLKAKLESGTR